MKSRSCFASRWLKLSKQGRRLKPSVLVVVVVALCASVLVPLASDPPLLGAESAEAYHCDSYPGDWQAVCELVHACQNSGGTVSGGRCVYPTTTTTTTALPTKPACKAGEKWVSGPHGYGACIATTPPPPTTTTTTTTTTTKPVGPVTASCHRHGSHFVNNECHTHPTNKACGQTVWVHTGDLSNLHTTYKVTATPPCAPPSCPSGQKWVNGACIARCAASEKWVSGPHGYGACIARCAVSEKWVNGACVSRCTASQKWVNGACSTSVTKVTCDPKIGEHRHVGTTSDTCHLDHTTENTCAHGQHLVGHDGCHSGHSTTTTVAPVARPVVSVSVYLYRSVAEGSPARFVVSAAPAPSQPYDVAVSVSTQGDFGVTSGTRTVTVPTSGRLFFDVATTDDDQTEPDGTINVRAVPNSRYTTAGGSATVTVKDNDILNILQPPTTPTTTTAPPTTTTTTVPRDPPPVYVVVPNVYVEARGTETSEGGYAKFTVAATPSPISRPLDVTVVVSTEGSYIATGGTRTVTVPTSGRFDLDVATIDDSTNEPDGNVSVRIVESNRYRILSDTYSKASVTVRDDDEPSTTVYFWNVDRKVTEGASAWFGILVSPEPSKPFDVTVEVSSSGGYTNPKTRTVTIPAGHGLFNFTVPTINDELYEPAGTVTATVQPSYRYTVSGSPTATTEVIDNDYGQCPVGYWPKPPPLPAIWIEVTTGNVLTQQPSDHIGSRYLTIPQPRWKRHETSNCYKPAALPTRSLTDIVKDAASDIKELTVQSWKIIDKELKIWVCPAYAQITAALAAERATTLSLTARGVAAASGWGGIAAVTVSTVLIETCD